jgi:hypothetical protein
VHVSIETAPGKQHSHHAIAIVVIIFFQGESFEIMP